MPRHLCWAAALAAALLLTACDRGQIFHHLRPDATVLAFGDGLTAGDGPQQSYPARLEKLISRRVVNAGRSGEGGAAAAARLPRALDEANPDLVILGLGEAAARGAPDLAALEATLRELFAVINRRGTPVVMIAAAPAEGGAAVAELYRQLGAELEVPIVPVELAPAGGAAPAAVLDPRTTAQLTQAIIDTLAALRAL